MRILLMTSGLGTGGAERVVVDLAVSAKNSGLPVAVLSMWRLNTPFEEELRQHEVQTVFLDKHGGVDFRMPWRIQKFIRQFKPDVIHTHRNVVIYSLASVLFRGNTPWLHTIHNPAEKDAGGYGVSRWVMKWEYAKGVVPVSIASEVSASFKRVFGYNPPVTIKNGIDVSKYGNDDKRRNPIRQSLGIASDEVLFLCVGRLEPQKNHLMLLKSFADVSAKNQKIRLALAGAGPLRDAAIDFVVSHGLKQKVFFLGVRTDVPDLLCAADAFVLASLWEGNPLCVMEAMAAGKAVIATGVGGVPELIENGTSGVIVPPANLEALSKAISDIAVDGALRTSLGKKARLRAEAEFDLSIMANGYFSLYKKLLEQEV